MKIEILIKDTKLLKNSNMQTHPINRVRLSFNLKTMVLVFINTLKNKLNMRINYLQMKRFCVLLGLFFMSLSFVNGQNYDFRKTTWGMSYKQVKTSEMHMTGIDSKNRLMYNVIVVGTPFTLVYTFNENSEFVSAGHIIF